MCTKSGAGLALEAMRLVPQSVGLARLAPDRPLAYGVVFLRLGGGLGCFSPAIDNYID